MDVRYINPFISGVDSVFTTMFKSPVLIGKPSLKRPDLDQPDVVAFIGISGDIVGSVAFCLPMNTALRVARAFAMTDMPLEDPQFADALGEVVNMIAGQAKAQFEGRDCSISLPRVVTGQAIRTLNSEITPVLVLPCDTQLGRFRLEVTAISSRAATARASAWSNQRQMTELLARNG